jgi:four helix bundle protein
MGSADEARLWCRCARDLGYLPEAESLAWQEGFQEIARMLQGFIARFD